MPEKQTAIFAEYCSLQRRTVDIRHISSMSAWATAKDMGLIGVPKCLQRPPNSKSSPGNLQAFREQVLVSFWPTRLVIMPSIVNHGVFDEDFCEADITLAFR